MNERVQVSSDLSPETPIARYMSFASFCSLLGTRALFFRRVGHFDDEFEGSGTEIDKFLRSGGAEALDIAVNVLWPAVGSSKEDYAERQRIAEEHRARVYHLETPFGDIALTDDTSYEAVLAAIRDWVDANCWHMSAVENVAMWKTFAQEGVCVHSTVGRLAAACTPPQGKQLLLAPITYIDYESSVLEKGERFRSVLHKNLPFQSENELRALVWDPRADVHAPRPKSDAGTLVQVDPSTLITKIGLAPKLSGGWFEALVKQTIRQQLTVEVVPSVLDRRPLR